MAAPKEVSVDVISELESISSLKEVQRMALKMFALFQTVSTDDFPDGSV